MNSSEYWAKRFKQLAETQLLSDKELVDELDKLYKYAQAEIESKISRWYMKFAKNNEISMSEAKKLLNADELEEFKWTVEEYIKHGETNIDDVFTKQLINASSKVHISRYEALLTELRQTAEKIMGIQENKLTEHLKTAYSENYLHTAFEIQKGTGVGVYLDGVDERSLSEVIKKPWASDGSNFSERIWKDRNSLVSELNTQLKRNIALGKSPDEAAKAIAKRFNTSKSNAARLVYTESAAISARATENCYKDLDVEEFEVLETLDSHTCEICGAMDGKHFPNSQYEIGVTVPPFHPRCRGTTVPYFDDMEDYGERAARDLEGNSFYVSADTTYEQWKQMQDDKYGAGSVDKAREIAYNEGKDKKQYEKYQVIFGDSEFKNFGEFQKIKYSDDINQWKKIKNSKQSLLNSKTYDELKKLNGKLGNKEVRLWYKAQDAKIESMLDKSLPLEQQAKTAHQLRNDFRTQARLLMKDRKEAEHLNVSQPNQSFEELLIHKKNKYGLTGDAAYEDIIRSSGTTNTEYDRKAGLKND